MPPSWHPDAQRIDFGGIGGFSGGAGKKIVWHTVEGGSIEGAVAAYRASGAYPHFTVQWVNGKLRIAQHAAIDQCVTTLRHPAGTPETNRAGCIQIEIADFAKNSGNWSDAFYAALADLARWIEANANVPRKCSVKFQVGVGRLSGGSFFSYAGHIGHMHAPGNDHWDPGNFKIEKIVGRPRVTRDLKVGDEGGDVREVQKAVNRHRRYRKKNKLGNQEELAVDGVYGPHTDRAIRRASYQLGAPKKEYRSPGASKRQQRYLRNPKKRGERWIARQRKRRG